MKPAAETRAASHASQPAHLPGVRVQDAELDVRLSGYRLRFARDDADREAIYRLRYQVLNVELDEGLAASAATGLDVDEYDSHGSHALVEAACCEVVGTYRLQTAELASHGFYSASEFDLAPRAAHGHVHADLLAPPHATFRCAPAPAASPAAPPAVEIPTLFEIHLRCGAKIVSPPAIDRAVGTIDFLTLIDLDAVPARVRRHLEGA